jgi:predicted nucleic acid-binding protein
VKVFFDSSSLVKRYVEEKGTGEILALCERASELGVSVICYPEIISALCRLRRERRIESSGYVAVKQALARDLRDAVICDLTETGILQSIYLLEENTLRAMDAIHIAAALDWEADLFVSGDVHQLKAAKKAGLQVKAVS